MNNVLYLSEIRPAQRELENVMNQRLAKDEELSGALRTYQAKARTLPYGIPHFGLRFPSFESIEPVLHQLETCNDPAMKDRFSLRVIRPTATEALSSDLIQAFVYTDM